MTGRPSSGAPTGSGSRLPQDMARALGVTPLDYEIVQEKAGSLARAGRALEEALAALAAFDATQGPKDALDDHQAKTRAALLADACERLWFFIVQREACGLRHHRDVYALYEVPTEVRIGMGPK